MMHRPVIDYTFVLTDPAVAELKRLKQTLEIQVMPGSELSRYVTETATSEDHPLYKQDYLGNIGRNICQTMNGSGFDPGM